MESFRKLRDDKGKVEFCEDESSDENDGNGRTSVSSVDDDNVHKVRCRRKKVELSEDSSSDDDNCKVEFYIRRRHVGPMF